MIYVDKLRDWGWHRGPSCRLISDALPGDNEELHSFAAGIGMKREWFQVNSLEPHYDLTAARRAIAVRRGAVELEDRPFHDILKKWREEAVAMVDSAGTEEEKTAVRNRLYS